MEKRLITAIIVTVAFLVLYSRLLPPPEKKPQQPEKPEVTAPQPEIPKTRPAVRQQGLPDIQADESVIETDLYRAVLTGAGGGMKSFRLKNYDQRWKADEEINREIEGIERRIAKITSDILTIRNRTRGETNQDRIDALYEREEALKAEQSLLESSKETLIIHRLQAEERKSKIEFLESELLSTTEKMGRDRLKERLKAERGVELIPPGAAAAQDYPPSLFFPSLGIDTASMLFKTGTETLALSKSNPAGKVVFESHAEGGLLVRKAFSFRNSDYSVNIRTEVENASGRTIAEDSPLIYYFPSVGMTEALPARGVVTGIVSYLDGRPSTYTVGGRGAKLRPGEPITRQGREGWIAIKGKYFAAIMLPEGPGCVLGAEALPGGAKRISARLPGFTLEAGETYSEAVTFYLGPQKPEELGKVENSLKEIIDFGFWSPVAKVIDFVLKVFNDFFKNYGLAIIALSLTVKIVFYPLTHKSFKAMQKMQDDMKKIQPKLNELKKKYGNNQPKLNKATMELYKKEGVNPMSGCKGGCFPMLLQMPVFFALYAVLNTSIEMRGANFLGWITDLSMPDPLRILPVLMGISMFWQQKMTGSGAAGPQQDQAKMMQWMMPIMLTFIFFSLPAGIVLYWFSFNIFTSLQQLIIKKHGA